MVAAGDSNHMREGTAMSCNCENQTASTEAAHPHVTDFSVAGFANTEAASSMPSFDGYMAAAIKFCAAASTQPGNKVCFTAPVFGSLCITLPIPIPAGASVKACGETCGSFIPTGLKVTIYLNNAPVFTKVVVGSC
jgi:hypothetical protein